MTKFRSFYLNASLWGLCALSLFLHRYPTANKFDWVNHLSPLVLAVLTLSTVSFLGVCLWKKRQGVSWKPLLFLLLFVLWSTGSFFLADVRSFGFSEIFVLWGMAGLFLLFSGEESFERQFPLAMITMLLVHAIWGVDAFLNTTHERFFGLFYDPLIAPNAWPNAFALFVLFTFPWLLYRAFVIGRRYLSLKLLVTGFVLGVFFMALSRAGMIALVIEMLLFLVVLWRDRQLKWPPANTLFLAILTIVLMASLTAVSLQNLKAVGGGDVTDIGERFRFVETEGSVSLTERLEFFEGSWELIKEKPLWGHGPMSFRFVYPQVQQGFLAISDHSHNFLLKWGMERGLPAALFFLVFLFMLFQRSNPFSSRTPLFQRVAWVSLLGGLAHSMVDFNFNFFSNMLVFWMLLAAVAPGRQLPLKEQWLQRFVVFVLFASVLSTSILLHYQQDKAALLSSGNATQEEIQTFKPLLPRWTFLALADVYSDDALLQELALQRQLDFNDHDADAAYRLANLLNKEGDLDQALEAYALALELKPKGTFLYYLAYVEFAAEQGKVDLIKEIRPVIQGYIEEYLPLYQINLHYTQAHSEMEYVNQLRELLSLE